jgi:hypothetical protein
MNEPSRCANTKTALTTPHPSKKGREMAAENSNLTVERLKELLHYDPETGVFTRKLLRGAKRAGAIAGSANWKGYICIHINGRNYRAHRLAWLYVTGNWPYAQIDHVDRDKANNKFANLREATNKQNHENLDRRRKDNTSGHRGVYWYKPYRRWMAIIRHN